MAQWLGQFTGLTHEGKVKDLETSLRRAVEAFRAAPAEDRPKKAKAVRKLAERLLSARLRVLRARMAVAPPPEHDERSAKLRAREAKLGEDGVTGILAELGATDV